jgi:transposase
VVELDRPKRAARRHGAKSDPLDAIRAAARPWAATSSLSRVPQGTEQRSRSG